MEKSQFDFLRYHFKGMREKIQQLGDPGFGEMTALLRLNWELRFYGKLCIAPHPDHRVLYIQSVRKRN